MFGFGSKKEKLEKKYRQLAAEFHRLSHTDRVKADQKFAEAEAIRKQLEQLEAESN